MNVELVKKAQAALEQATSFLDEALKSAAGEKSRRALLADAQADAHRAWQICRELSAR